MFFSFQTNVDLKWTSTVNTVNFSGMALMKETGKVAVRGRVNEGLPWGLFLINPKDGSMEQPKVSGLCDHWPSFLCLQIEGCEYLAHSCARCGQIKLINFKKGATITAFSEENVRDMVEGEANRLYVLIKRSGHVMEVDCSRTVFVKLRVIEYSLKRTPHMCYVPSPNRLLVISGVPIEPTSGLPKHVIQATSCDTGIVAWRLKGKINDKNMATHNMLFLPSHNVILVSDGRQSGVLVLNPNTGEHIETIQVPDHVDEIWDLHLHAGQVIMKHGNVAKEGDLKISCFSVIP